MWFGFDPELQRNWQIVQGMVARQRQTPTREEDGLQPEPA